MFKFVFIVLAIAISSFAGILQNPERAPGHTQVADSTGDYVLKFRGTLYDSVSATRLDGPHSDNHKHIDNEAVARLSYEGKLTDKFHFKGLVQISNDKTNRDIPENFYDPYDGFPYNKQSDNNRTWDIFRLSMDYNVGFAKLVGGIDYVSLGVARHNKVILRGDEYQFRPWQDSSYRLQIPAPTPYFGYEFKVGPLTYQQYAMKLYHEKNLGKYMHAHRLGASLPFDIELGVSELVMYGSTVEPAGSNPNVDGDSTGRDFEWSYVIPFIPYVFEEHFHGDKDNNALAFDLSVKTIRHWDFYGEMLWDDMKSPTKMFDDSWWGNKWAATIGVENEQKIGPVALNWNIEYTRVEPWVYTHHKGAGYVYSSYGQSLGSDLGPNSQEIYTAIEAAYKGIDLKLYVSSVAKDTSFSSNLYDMHTQFDATDKKFLAKSSTYRYRELGAELNIFPTEWMWLRGAGALYIGDYEGYRLEASGGLTW